MEELQFLRDPPKVRICRCGHGDIAHAELTSGPGCAGFVHRQRSDGFKTMERCDCKKFRRRTLRQRLKGTP